MGHPPQFHFVTESRSQVETKPWSACLEGGCWDGFPTDVPDVGSPEALDFGWDLPGWTFNHVTFRRHNAPDTDCALWIVKAERTSPRTFRVEPAGPPGDSDVDIFGRGQGDAITTVRWHTPTRGEPRGSQGCR